MVTDLKRILKGLQARGGKGVDYWFEKGVLVTGLKKVVKISRKSGL